MNAFKAKYVSTCTYEDCTCPERRINVGDLKVWNRERKGQDAHNSCFLSHDSRFPVLAVDKAVKVSPKVSGDAITDMIVSATIERLSDVLDELVDARIPATGVDEKAIIGLIRKYATVKVELTRDSKPVSDIENSHYMMPKLIGTLLDEEPAYLYGPAGTGKTHGAMQALKALGLDTEFISLNLQTSDTRLSGFIDANGIFREPGFYRAYSGGKGMIIDEVDNASGNVLTALNSAIANGHASFPIGVISKHKDFRLICTGNTAGRGASRVYSDRRQLDGAFLDRFYFIHWDYDKSLERSIALALNPNMDPIVDWIQSVREFCGKEYPNFPVTPRSLQRIAKGLRRGEKLADTLDGALWHGLDGETVTRITKAVPMPMGV